MLFKKIYILLSLIVCIGSLNGSADRVKRKKIPHRITLQERFTNALLTNDTDSMQSMLSARPSLVKTQYKGGNTPFHLLATMEQRGHDPHEMITIFAKIMPTHFRAAQKSSGNITEDSFSGYDMKKHAGLNKAFQSFCMVEADVVNPKFNLVLNPKFTSRTRTCQNPAILMGTPLELAVGHHNAKTLAAFVQYMPVSPIVMENPVLSKDFKLFKAIVKYEKTTRNVHKGFGPITQKPSLPITLITHITKTFGTKGLLLLHRNGFDIHSKDYSDIDGNVKTLFEMFAIFHPNQALEIAHLSPKSDSLWARLFSCCRSRTSLYD